MPPRARNPAGIHNKDLRNPFTPRHSRLKQKVLSGGKLTKSEVEFLQQFPDQIAPNILNLPTELLQRISNFDRTVCQGPQIPMYWEVAQFKDEYKRYVLAVECTLTTDEIFYKAFLRNMRDFEAKYRLPQASEDVQLWIARPSDVGEKRIVTHVMVSPKRKLEYLRIEKMLMRLAEVRGYSVTKLIAATHSGAVGVYGSGSGRFRGTNHLQLRLRVCADEHVGGQALRNIAWLPNI
jgi:hypothetical protein